MPRKLELGDLWRFGSVADPQVSPDGDRVIFVYTDIDYEGDSYSKKLWMWNRAEGAQEFTHGPGSDTYPRWSPDGERILFLSSGRTEEKKPQLLVIPAGGGEARLVAELEGGVSNPQWFPDSERILFTSRVKEERDSNVLVVKRPRYKLNGEGLFPGERPHLFSVKIDGDPVQLTEGEFDVEAFQLSPDGEEIALVTSLEAMADLTFIRDIYIIPSRGGNLSKVTEGKHVIESVSWSPDGGRIAFQGHDLRRSVATNTDIWVVPREGGEAVNVTGDFDRTIGLTVGSDLRGTTPPPGAVWSPEGDSIYFLTADIPYSNLYKVDLETRRVEQVTRGKSLDGFTLSRDGGVVAFNALDSTSPPELWVMEDGEEKRVTTFNDSLLEEVQLVEPEHFTWTNEEGREIDAWILKPLKFTPDETYPAILEIHGGPRGVYGDAPFHEFQLLASEGYAVFYTNPRGSGGYDEEYHAVLRGEWGGPDYRDLMDFTDETLERYSWIDPSKLGVTGGSYGGYLTNWIITHTDRFKSAVTLRSTCNRHSFQGTSDIGFLYAEEANGGNPWDDEDKLLSQSPIRYVKNAKTPTLLIHSEEDLRCPMEQAEQFFEALMRVGVETELVRFPEENHGLSRSGKPKHREERLQHILRWFNKHLKS
jgi:acylaminoacyl-peptidase